MTAVDHDMNLFSLVQAVSGDLQEKILCTEWLDLQYDQQPGQESWSRRKIKDSQLSWLDQWHAEIIKIWPQLQQTLGLELQHYGGTAFWLDEPGFVCPIHTDGEMPGSLHLCWIGARHVGTTFYYFKNPSAVRYRVDFSPNHGYVMINQCEPNGFRLLQWHGMLDPVPPNTFRLTSYTWLVPVK